MSVQDQITATAQQYGIDPNLALSVANAESGFNQNAVSPAGAIGVFQLMPSTAAMLGVDPTNLADNIKGGIEYLSQMLSQFGGDVEKALAAYNWGPSNVTNTVLQWGDAWLNHIPSQTLAYIRQIVGSVSSPIDDISNQVATDLEQTFGLDSTTLLYLMAGAVLIALIASRL